MEPGGDHSYIQMNSSIKSEPEFYQVIDNFDINNIEVACAVEISADNTMTDQGVVVQYLGQSSEFNNLAGLDLGNPIQPIMAVKQECEAGNDNYTYAPDEYVKFSALNVIPEIMIGQQNVALLTSSPQKDMCSQGTQTEIRTVEIKDEHDLEVPQNVENCDNLKLLSAASAIKTSLPPHIVAHCETISKNLDLLRHMKEGIKTEKVLQQTEQLIIKSEFGEAQTMVDEEEEEEIVAAIESFETVHVMTKDFDNSQQDVLSGNLKKKSKALYETKSLPRRGCKHDFESNEEQSRGMHESNTTTSISSEDDSTDLSSDSLSSSDDDKDVSDINEDGEDDNNDENSGDENVESDNDDDDSSSSSSSSSIKIKTRSTRQARTINRNSPKKNETLKNLHNCSKCGRQFNSSSKLKAHWAANPNHAKGKKAKLQAVMKKQKQLQNDATCPICKKVLYDRSNVKRHLNSVHERNLYKKNSSKEELSDLTCKICKMKFISSIKYNRHVRSHDVLHKDGKFICKICNKVYDSKRNLNRHILHHKEKNSYVCEVCAKSYSNAVDLATHLLRNHNNSKNFNKEDYPHCDICGKYFATKSGVTKHRIIHSDDRNFQCEQCGKGFKAKGDMKRHMNSHNGVSYPCDICHRTFSSRTYVELHKKSHTGSKLFYCDYCGKEFFVYHTLTRHMRQHTGEKPYQCKICHKKVTSNASLKNHMLIHAGDKPFKCDQCDMAFTSKSHLRDHKNTHSGNKPYKCPYCVKAFFCKRSMVRHHRKNHPEQKTESSEED